MTSTGGEVGAPGENAWNLPPGPRRVGEAGSVRHPPAGTNLSLSTRAGKLIRRASVFTETKHGITTEQTQTARISVQNPFVRL